MNDRCAIYMRADPLMKKDIETVKKIQKIYPHVDIILDRKWQNEKYKLSFSDRSDIIRHDFKDAGIENYKILPNDISKYESLMKEGVKNIAVEINPYSKMGGLAEREKLTRQMIPDANLIFIPNFNDNVLADNTFLFEMIMEDSTHSLYKKYISEFAYIKTKIKLMTKIGLTGNRGCGLGIVVEEFKNRKYEVIDLDQILINIFEDKDEIKQLYRKLKQKGIDTEKLVTIDGITIKADRDRMLKACLKDDEIREICVKALYDSVYMKMARIILNSDKKIVVVSSTLMFEFKFDWMFDKIITVYANEEKQVMRMREYRGYSEEKINMIMKLHMPIDQKVKKSDYFIDGGIDEDATKRNTINLLNCKLESGF